MTTDSAPPGDTFDPTTAVPARTYAALRGASKEAFGPDREAVDKLKKAIHDKVDEVAQENAAALVRAVRHLASEGHLQFADLGCGKPVQGGDTLELPDLYEAGVAVRPEIQWLALDSDELVVTTCRALLRGPAVHVVQQDLRRSAAVLDAMGTHLRLDRPVVVILGAVLHFLDDGHANDLMFALRARLAPDSVLVLTHVTGHGMDPARIKSGQVAYEQLHGGIPIYVRSRDEIVDLVRDFRLHNTGVLPTIDFLPDPTERTPERDAPHFLMLMAKRPEA
ncbi:SAM-dependent methyltransferase [Nonomuraea sp. NPDC052265]|uniref:SAM-dependent methyltransferase n=1 Tax=Nonomuraea sp. NPDC052265 TaxID=3364374 RepID=UPI0037C6A1CD